LFASYNFGYLIGQLLSNRSK